MYLGISGCNYEFLKLVLKSYLKTEKSEEKISRPRLNQSSLTCSVSSNNSNMFHD